MIHEASIYDPRLYSLNIFIKPVNIFYSHEVVE